MGFLALAERLPTSATLGRGIFFQKKVAELDCPCEILLGGFGGLMRNLLMLILVFNMSITLKYQWFF